MVTRRTLLLYNFGIAALLMFIGAMGIIGADAAQIRRLNDLPNFNAEALAFIADEQDVEKLRARTDDSSKVFKDASTLAFFVAALFAVSGVLQLVYSRVRRQAGLVE